MRSFVHRLPIPELDIKARARRDRGIHCGWKWTRFRNTLLAQQPLCVRCGALGEELHHVVSRHVAPERMYDATNCVTLCKRCHYAEHGR